MFEALKQRIAATQASNLLFKRPWHQFGVVPMDEVQTKFDAINAQWESFSPTIKQIEGPRYEQAKAAYESLKGFHEASQAPSLWQRLTKSHGQPAWHEAQPIEAVEAEVKAPTVSLRERAGQLREKIGQVAEQVQQTLSSKTQPLRTSIAESRVVQSSKSAVNKILHPRATLQAWKTARPSEPVLDAVVDATVPTVETLSENPAHGAFKILDHGREQMMAMFREMRQKSEVFQKKINSMFTGSNALFEDLPVVTKGSGFKKFAISAAVVAAAAVGYEAVVSHETKSKHSKDQPWANRVNDGQDAPATGRSVS